VVFTDPKTEAFLPGAVASIAALFDHGLCDGLRALGGKSALAKTH